MQRKLGVQENIPGTACARHFDFEQFACLAVEHQRWMAEAAVRVILAGRVEGDGIDSVCLAVADAASRIGPATLAGGRLRQGENFLALQARFDRLLWRVGLAQVDIGAWRQWRKQADQRAHHFWPEVHRYRRGRQDEQQHPSPDRTRTVQVEIEPVATLPPAEGEGFAPGGGARKTQPQRRQAVDDPDHGDDAHHQHAEIEIADVRQVHAVVQLVEKRQQVFGRQRNSAPLAAALDFAARRVDRHLVETERVRQVARRIDMGIDADVQGVAGLEMQRQKAHRQARVGRFEAAGQRQRVGERGCRAAAGDEQLRIQPLVQFMVPGNDGAGQAGNKQENGHAQPGPTVDQDKERAKGGECAVSFCVGHGKEKSVASFSLPYENEKSVSPWRKI